MNARFLTYVIIGVAFGCTQLWFVYWVVKLFKEQQRVLKARRAASPPAAPGAAAPSAEAPRASVMPARGAGGEATAADAPPEADAPSGDGGPSAGRP
jgi:hypothetical protein